VTRALDWAGCANVRDLGGVAIEGGGETRHGVFVRADNIRRLSDEGWESLAAHGVTRIVDLRSPDERATDPPRDVDIDVVEIPLLGESDPTQREDVSAYLATGDVAGYRADQYLQFLERHKPEFGRVFAALAEHEDGAILFHCFAGKDRTGLIAALLLRLAGASLEDAADDYALSDERVLRLFAHWIDAAETDEERNRRTFLMRTPGEAMHRTLAELGDVEEYLRSTGVSEEQLAELKERLAPA
jgi:protein tyrosine/serine phosphatase